jgi:eukaryotic-like serine/threonine-protein kinase
MTLRDLAPQTVVDERYSIINRIGSGGMADVYCAQDLQLGRKVALKLLYRRFAEDEEFVERFKREASAAAGLQHPNVVGVYDRGEWDGTYYIAMEYLEGRSLKQEEEGPLPAERAIDIVIQILRAARFAHQRGIIHRDIKPHNVILDEEGRAKVTDFGIARAGASDMTETGSIMGTAQYLSPEQAQGHAVSAESDLYAIGIVLYELLTGRVPFDGDSPVTIALKQVSELPVPPSAYVPSVSQDLDAIVLHALEKDPARRFGDADEFIAALEQAKAGLVAVPAGQSTAVFGAVPEATAATALAAAGAPPDATDDELAAMAYPEDPLEPESEEERRRRRNRWLIVGAAILLLLLAGLAFALTRPEKTTVPDVVGKQFEAARTVLINAGFKVERQGVTSTVPKDRVLREDPQPGTKQKKDSTITLTVSDGPGSTVVPDVTNLTESKAKSVLKDAGFKTTTQKEPSDAIGVGRATRTSPSGGQQIERGTLVTIFVSSGPAKVTVPNVTGQNEASATAELSNVGLKADVTEEESDQDPGSVIRQSPSSGSKVDKGSTVTIVVAKAASRVQVPGVIGQDQGSASSELSAAGLTVVTDSQNVTDPGQNGVVVDQDPGEGAQVKKGSKVTIVVGRYTPPTPTTPGGTGAPGQ